MKTIATLRDNEGRIKGIVSGAEFRDQRVIVDGKEWRFDYDKHLGPHWMRKNGEPRSCQCPTNSKVWAAFDKWLSKHDPKPKRKRSHEIDITKDYSQLSAGDGGTKLLLHIRRTPRPFGSRGVAGSEANGGPPCLPDSSPGGCPPATS